MADAWSKSTICQENNGPGLLALSWVMLSVTTLVVALRLYFKGRHVNRIGWDDYMIVLSLVRKTSNSSSQELTRRLDVRLRRSGLSHDTDLFRLRAA